MAPIFLIKNRFFIIDIYGITSCVPVVKIIKAL